MVPWMLGADDKSGGRGQRRGPRKRGLCGRGRYACAWWTTRVRGGDTALFSINDESVKKGS